MTKRSVSFEPLTRTRTTGRLFTTSTGTSTRSGPPALKRSVCAPRERRPQERVRASRGRVGGEDASGLIEGVLILALLEQREAEAEPRLLVVRVFDDQLAVEFFGLHELALLQGALGACALLVARSRG